jgi:nicotinate-nucleotide adenylyltransferase
VRLGVLGGTFDPPHLGHLVLAEFAREQLALDRVRFIPAGDPWRKTGREVSPAAHRLEMTHLAIDHDPYFEIDDCEVLRPGATYTVETLLAVRESLQPDDVLYFIAGEDALADMPSWRDPAGIVAVARIAVVPREGAPLPAGLPFPPERIDRIEMPYIGISSTLIRERVRAGLSLRYLVAPAVAAYIRAQGLYLS